MIGLPAASFKVSGSDDLTTRQDATGSKEASLFGSSKMNLFVNKKEISIQTKSHVKRRQNTRGRVMVIGHDLLELKVDKVLWVKRTLLLFNRYVLGVMV